MKPNAQEEKWYSQHAAPAAGLRPKLVVQLQGGDANMAAVFVLKTSGEHPPIFVLTF